MPETDADLLAERLYGPDGLPRPEFVDATPVHLEGRLAGVHSLLVRLDEGFRSPAVNGVVWTSSADPLVRVAAMGGYLSVERGSDVFPVGSLDAPDLFSNLAETLAGLGIDPKARA